MATVTAYATPTIGQRLRSIIGNQFGADVVEQNLEKAIQAARDRVAEPQSMFYDPLSMFMGFEWLNKRTQGLGFQDLRRMAVNPIIWSIITTRINQIAAFCTPQQTAYDVGFRIVGKDNDAKKDTMAVTAITNWIYSMGIPGYGEDLLENMARKFMRDSLILDQACAEIIYRNNDLPAYIVVIDGATVRKLRPSLEYYLPDQPLPFYAQVVDNRVVAEYQQNELMYGIRNPQTDITAAGYGLSELEVLTRVVTTILNTERFNSGMLTQGGTSKGILVVKGDADRPQMETFKRDFREAIRNASSYWRPPVLQIGKDGEIDWVQLDRSNRDMEYNQLFDFLIKQACSVYQMDPAEINWTIGQAGARMNFMNKESDKQVLSQKRGLKPLLQFFANQINYSLIHRIDPRFHIEFVGMDHDRMDDASIRSKEVATYRTVNEQRQELGLDPVEGGDIILNQLYLQANGLIQGKPGESGGGGGGDQGGGQGGGGNGWGGQGGNQVTVQDEPND